MKRPNILLCRRRRSRRWSTRGFVPPRWPGARFSSGRGTPGGRCGPASRSSRTAAPSRTSPRISIPAGEAGAVDDFRMLERLVKLALWAHGGFRIHLDAPAELVGRAPRALPRHRDRALRLRDRGRARLRPPDRDRGDEDPPCRTLEQRRPGRSPRRVSHRLRSRRQRPQGGRADRRTRRLERRDRVGSVPPARPGLPLERDHGFAAPRGRAPAARRRHRRQRGRASTSTTG